MQRANKKRILLTTTSSSLANQISQSYNRLIDKADKKSVLNIPEGIGIDELLKILEFSEDREVKFNTMSDIPPEEFPIFVTTNEVLKLIDGCLNEPFLKRGVKGEIEKELKLGFKEAGMHF